MSQPYIGQIQFFSFPFAPKGWALCNGQLLAINTNQALFSILGTTYGGNGVTTFGLPNLQGRVPVGYGNNYALGQSAGEAAHTLVVAEMPTHTHTLSADAATAALSNSNKPTTGAALGQSIGVPSRGTPFAANIYTTDTSAPTPMGGGSIGTTGGQPHQNQQPYLTMSACIALSGIFPSRS